MENLDFENEVKIDDKATIVGNCRLGKNVKIKGACYIENSIIEENSVIINSMIVESIIGKNCSSYHRNCRFRNHICGRTLNCLGN